MFRRIGIVTTVLSYVVLAAHFMRGSMLPLVIIALVTPLLLLIHRTWATRVVQGGLVLAAIIWGLTLVQIAVERMHNSEPWGRMAVILSVVAAMALVSAALLCLKPVSRSDAALENVDND
jgi:ABC-type transport system involved in cytochrome c biogenesis permease subunit